MEKIIKTLKENKWIHYSLIFFIGLIMGLLLINIQIKDTHDGDLHLLRLIGTVDTLNIGEVPPLINQNFCNSAGYAINLFYAPLVTYVPLILKIFNISYTNILKIYGTICIILSGITMYHFVYQVTKKREIAFFAAIFYMIAPYKLANVFKRYAMGEFTAAIFIPYVFLGLYNLLEGDKKKHYYIAIGTIGLLLSHTVTTFYIGIFSAFYVLFNIKKLFNKEIIKKCIINFLFIVLISMFFYLPLMEATGSAEYVITNNDKMMTNGEAASENTISFLELFKYNNNREKGWEVTTIIGLPVVILLISTIYAGTKIAEKYRNFYLINIIFAIVSIFMATVLFPWKIMPDFLCKLQFPWRMIGFATFFISFICGINLYIILNTFKKDIIKLIIVILILIVAISESILIMTKFFSTDNTLDNKYETKILTNPKISHMQINRDYMPMKALINNSYVKNREDKTYVLQGNTEIIEETKIDLKDIIKTKNSQIGDIIEFPYYYYVGYEINIETEDENYISTPTESENGYLSYTFDRNLEDTTITVEYKGTKLQKLSYIISFIGILIFASYIIYENKKNGEKNVK